MDKKEESEEKLYKLISFIDKWTFGKHRNEFFWIVTNLFECRWVVGSVEETSKDVLSN